MVKSLEHITCKRVYETKRVEAMLFQMRVEIDRLELFLANLGGLKDLLNRFDRFDRCKMHEIGESV